MKRIIVMLSLLAVLITMSACSSKTSYKTEEKTVTPTLNTEKSITNSYEALNKLPQKYNAELAEKNGDVVNIKGRNSKIVIETNSTDLNHISNLIFEKYLNEFKKDNVLKNMKLKDYEVNKIYNIESNNAGFEFYVDYSVKPFFTTAYWIAGNGIEKGSWVNDKVLHVYVERTGQEYTIKGTGTGK